MARFDGADWVIYTPEDGLIDGDLLSILEGVDGTLWFAGSHEGRAAVTRYDRRTPRIHTEADGLTGIEVGRAACVDSSGNMWLTTGFTDPEPAWADATKGGNGVFRFDGER